MKKIILPIFLLLTFFAKAQLLTWSPVFVQESSLPVTITMNANYGNQGLLNYTPTTDVYVQMGVITTLSTSANDWKYVRTVWGTTASWEQATNTGTNLWAFKIDSSTSLRNYFGIKNVSEKILKIAILFRNGTGSLKQANTDGNNMYVPVYDTTLHARIDNPFRQPEYMPIPVPMVKKVGDIIPIVAEASLTGSQIKIYYNGSLLSTVTGTKDSISATIAKAGTQTIVAVATNGVKTSSDTLTFFIPPASAVLSLPAGVSDGINYFPGDTSATLVLFAPNKTSIVVVGDFNNWVPSAKYVMNITPDGQRFWIHLSGLMPDTEYAYQYLIDDSIQVADYNTEKVLDANVDPNIPASTYPKLKAFPAKASGWLTSVLQTGQTPYAWSVTNFKRPDKRNLVIYELLVRDFIATQNWQTLTDTLTYLKRLGVNAIELMPFCNFEGYSSWGYNQNFFFAPDKVYGTATALKQFVDACHKQGIAVIQDLAMQDVFGSSPLATMYWNPSLGVPASNNPWLDQYPTHAYNVGYEFNHSSSATIALRNRIYAYWINNFHIDGFRFDLAGGYTQTNTCDATGNNCNVGNWNNYDQGRVNTWDSIYAQLQKISAGSYCILESFVNSNENQVYVNQGMMVWGSGGDMNSPVTQASMGYSSPTWDFSSGFYFSNSGYTQPGVVDYQESHDETTTGDERVMYKNENYGNSSGSYTIKDTNTALLRAAMTAAFFTMMPGPKMLWQFVELGYDYSPDACSNGALTCSNVDPKPLPWGKYYHNPNRQALYNVYSKLLNLRNVPQYAATFTNNGNATNTHHDFSGPVKWMSNYSSSLQVMVYGNFDVVQQTGSISFPSTGKWYNYLTGDSINVTTTNLQSVTLQPGEYYVYVNIGGTLTDVPTLSSYKTAQWQVYPNPAGANTLLHIQTDMNNVELQLTDISGRVLYKNSYNSLKFGEQVFIPLQGFARGIYLLEINSDKGTQAQKIIIE